MRSYIHFSHLHHGNHPLLDQSMNPELKSTWPFMPSPFPPKKGCHGEDFNSCLPNPTEAILWYSFPRVRPTKVRGATQWSARCARPSCSNPITCLISCRYHTASSDRQGNRHKSVTGLNRTRQRELPSVAIGSRCSGSITLRSWHISLKPSSRPGRGDVTREE